MSTKALIEGLTALNEEMLAVHGHEIKLINTFGEAIHLTDQRTVQALRGVAAQASESRREVMAELDNLRHTLQGGYPAPTQLRSTPAVPLPTWHNLPPLDEPMQYEGAAAPGEDYGHGGDWRQATDNVDRHIPSMRPAPAGYHQ